MKFNDKINSYFKKIKITFRSNNHPTSNLHHLYADYVEVISLFSNQNYVTESDIFERFKYEGIIKKRKDDRKPQKDDDSDRAQKNDDNEVWINEIFREISNRSLMYGDHYPFMSDQNGVKLLEQEDLQPIHKVYLFLLLASCLNLFVIFEPELTKEFETVCGYVLKEFTPKPAIVKAFGKTSEYEGTALEKIRNLSKDIRIKLSEEYLNNISPKGVQEKGLDIISWFPFDDDVSNKFLLLCQCACGKKWFSKINETRRYENYFLFHGSKPMHVMFIPYSLIDYHKSNFFQSDEIFETLLFERKRILNYLQDLSFFENLESKILVDKCIVSEEDIV